MGTDMSRHGSGVDRSPQGELQNNHKADARRLESLISLKEVPCSLGKCIARWHIAPEITSRAIIERKDLGAEKRL